MHVINDNFYRPAVATPSLPTLTDEIQTQSSIRRYIDRNVSCVNSYTDMACDDETIRGRMHTANKHASTNALCLLTVLICM